MKNSRLIGGKPKIGIRPIIDGRRGGIRESLEDMTMTMARKVAELYSSELYHNRTYGFGSSFVIVSDSYRSALAAIQPSR